MYAWMWRGAKSVVGFNGCILPGAIPGLCRSGSPGSWGPGRLFVGKGGTSGLGLGKTSRAAAGDFSDGNSGWPFTSVLGLVSRGQSATRYGLAILRLPFACR